MLKRKADVGSMFGRCRFDVGPVDVGSIMCKWRRRRMGGSGSENNGKNEEQEEQKQ